MPSHINTSRNSKKSNKVVNKSDKWFAFISIIFLSGCKEKLASLEMSLVKRTPLCSKIFTKGFIAYNLYWQINFKNFES